MPRILIKDAPCAILILAIERSVHAVMEWLRWRRWCRRDLVHVPLTRKAGTPSVSCAVTTFTSPARAQFYSKGDYATCINRYT